MNFMINKNILIIYGGRVDLSGTSTYHCFNDIHVLNLEKLSWATVKMHGIIPEARSAHSCGVLGNKLIIFGGIN